ncbi:UNVERIFIED_CONTAM: GDSL esterase/lipase [Sesamum radiatum]|uniref:GDSL esterase/lipase n=1 Tax=Sesamum radiatum TaxID=300843 RepID=A0AAW2KGC5_SESRA
MTYSNNLNICCLFLLFLASSLQTIVVGEPKVPCLFIFGDSLVDNGNNVNRNTTAKVNYFPYGIDFPGGPTGRFNNGRNIADILAELLGFDKYIAPFASSTNQDILRGVNYGSGGSGILDETGHLFRLYDDGARKVAVFALGKLGCIPQQLATYGTSDASSCVETSNDVVQSFNENLKILIHDLNRNLPDAKFVYTRDTSDSESYGNISNLSEPCCGVSAEDGQCVAGSVPCSNRDAYLFWDSFHPTEAATLLSAKIAYGYMSPLFAESDAVAIY